MIEVSLNTKNSKGKLIKLIEVHTNDPANKIVKLTITADVIEEKGK